MKRLLFIVLLFASGALLFSAGTLRAQTPNDVVFGAMHDELQRSMKKLQLEQLSRPYFISYRVVETNTQSVIAGFGSLMSSSANRGRYLSVSVRVGDYSLDNSNFLSIPFGNTGVATRMFGGTVLLPLDDNIDELRRQIWLATDGAYKKALEDLSGKRAALENKHRPDNVPDFTKGTPVSIVDSQPPVDFDRPAAEKLARQLSALFRQLAAIQTSRVHISAENVLERFIDSEGTTFTRRSGLVSLNASAETQAEDGTPMSDSYRIYCRSVQDLPTEASLNENVLAMANRLIQRRTAPVLEQYNGPVLFEGQAAAEVFARHFAEQLSGEPRLVSDNPQMLQAFRNQLPETAFLTKLGARVMPDFISVVDNPAASRENGEPLLGGYKVDEEGTAARETLVVENGILKTLLTSRAPVRGVLQSTGNLRGRSVGPSNLFVNASKSSSPEDVTKQFMGMLKSRGSEYGIVVRKLSNRALVQAYRVYADGHEEPIRKASIMGFNSSTFKELAAVSNQRNVYTEAFTPRRNSPFDYSPVQTTTLVSYVVPDLLFEDVTVDGPTEDTPKPPALPHPYFEKRQSSEK
jgi:predicted Zn-dependent protease